jgi:FG-GAP repeat
MTPIWPRSSKLNCAVLSSAALFFSSQLALPQFTQEGAKLVGTGAVGAAQQGFSVALSADGNTAIVGGPGDNSGAGAAWAFTRSGGVWTNGKLVGTGAVGAAQQGFSVALSADGNTAIVGGPGDNSGAGAASVYTRNGGIWSQPGSKLVGTDATKTRQGSSVALSADGNTAIVGGLGDNSGAGAAWVFTRSGGVWTSGKLVGTDAVGPAGQGISVALSADGNTAIVGGPQDASYIGAAWVYTRTGGVWRQQGRKLTANNAGTNAGLGWSVALSADGNTAIIGGPNGQTGAAWVFVRNGNVWGQQSGKLVANDAAGPTFQGNSVALSADGNTAIVGGFFDNAGNGATWVYTRNEGVWRQQGRKLVGTYAVGTAQQGYSVALSADGNTAIVGGPNGQAGAAWVFVQPSQPVVKGAQPALRR